VVEAVAVLDAVEAGGFAVAVEAVFAAAASFAFVELILADTVEVGTTAVLNSTSDEDP